MIKVTFILFSAFALFSSHTAFSQFTEAPKDTLTYHYKTFYKESSNIVKDNFGTDTAFIRIEYPEFADSSVNKFIESNIWRNSPSSDKSIYSLSNILDVTTPYPIKNVDNSYKNIAGYADMYIKNYDDYYKIPTSYERYRIYRSVRTKVLRQTATLISVYQDICSQANAFDKGRLNYFFYIGHDYFYSISHHQDRMRKIKHGIDISSLIKSIDLYPYNSVKEFDRIYFNYNLVEKRQITLDDLFTPENLKALNRIAEVLFRKNEGIKPEKSLAMPYEYHRIYFDNNIFHLTNNFLITNKGLEFQFGGYGDRSRPLLIPYSACKHLLKENAIPAGIRME